MAATFRSPYPPISIPKTSFFQFLVEGGAKYPSSTPAYIDGVTGETVNRGTLERECLSLASALLNADKHGLLGLSRGSVIAVFSPNSLLYPKVILSLGAAGICGAYANATYVDAELAHAFKISDSSHILVHPALLRVALNMLRSHLNFSENEIKKRVIIMAHKKDIPTEIARQGWIGIDDLLSGSTPLSQPASFDGDDAESVASIFFSSGTTGLSKAVALTHYNIVSHLAQSHASWPYYVHGRDVLLAVVPLFHCFGGIILVKFSYSTGVPVVVLPKFEPELFLSAIQRFRITRLSLVPPLLTFITKYPLIEKYDLSSVRFIFVGAAPISAAALSSAVDFFKKRGTDLEVVQGYGLTETSAGVAFLPVEHMTRKAGTVGFLVPNMEGRLVDDDEKDVPRGMPGEFWVRGPNIFKGYVGNLKATQESLTSDGWFKTGDVMTIDEEGFLTVVDRKKELIKYKGLQVAPAELEAVLFTHPQVADAGVIGVYSEKDTSEVPRAYIVPKDAQLLAAPQSAKDSAEKGIQEWMKNKVAPYKLLRGGVVFVESIPRSAAGKILRKDLRSSLQPSEKARL